ncbi:MAG: hypothetical protein A2W00_08040 [Candidatus Eisenbacteria bacterium RBG_16_71_46]|nr:MAG: hypothetical protein A2W00_08040 [Candidatus Eisenbacteria bacterium RBG_16_71_46]
MRAGLAAPAETFEFFSDAANLEALTPAFLHLRILTPLPIEMREGALIAYRLSLFGIPLHWLTRIDEWTPGRGFVDRQLRGPYALWIHRRRFEACGSGTRVHDRVEYALPLDPWSRPAHPLWVRPTVKRIFAFRREAIARRLGDRASPVARGA